MVDPDLLEDNSLAQQGLQFLYESEVLHKQRLRLLERLASGDPAEKDEDLLRRIKEFRIQAGFVESLLELGGKYSKNKEKDDEPR